MFPGVPPVIRVALRHRTRLLLGAVIVALLFVVCQQIAVPVLPQEVSVVQLDPKDFPEFSRNHTNDNFDPPSLLISPSAAFVPRPAAFLPGSSRPRGEAYTKAVIVARTKSEEVTWVNERLNGQDDGKLVIDEWTMYMYTTDDLTAAGLHTPLNKGREAMAYLTYIVDYYNELPDISVFMHAHKYSWHDNMFDLNAVQTLQRLNLNRVVRLGFMNLRCGWDPGCPDHIHPRNTDYDIFKPEQAVFAMAWREIFPLEELPETLSQPCCAQFALTSDRIKAWPQAHYVALRDWILTTDLEDSISGRVFEYIYQYIWTGRPIYCPEEHECYCDGYGVCFGGPDGYREYVDKRREWNVLNTKVNDFVNDGSNVFSATDVMALVDRLERGETIDEEELGKKHATENNLRGNKHNDEGGGGEKEELPDRPRLESPGSGGPREPEYATTPVPEQGGSNDNDKTSSKQEPTGEEHHPQNQEQQQQPLHPPDVPQDVPQNEKQKDPAPKQEDQSNNIELSGAPAAPAPSPEQAAPGSGSSGDNSASNQDSQPSPPPPPKEEQSSPVSQEQNQQQESQENSSQDTATKEDSPRAQPEDKGTQADTESSKFHDETIAELLKAVEMSRQMRTLATWLIEREAEAKKGDEGQK
ncbi:hypothetical protein B0H63DRAFT_452129 [Podospora didyma]|uniref:Uncharacterized protein n=1 Tax=Podospora didyma TaxID=330526 RepID=A0AAE0KLA1_9PEZI|nr:hypothetical protein B0H63DRAFT_452129 [Podospora didyma]